MREYLLNPRFCSVYINPKVDVDICDIDLLVIEPKNKDDLLLMVRSMADGVPVIALRTNESIQLIANGVTGLLYNFNHEKHQLIEYMRDDPHVRREIGLNAKHWAQDYSDLEILVHNMWEKINDSN